MPTSAERVLAADRGTVCPAASGSVNIGAGKKENRIYSRVSKKHHEKDKDKFREAGVDGIIKNSVCEEGGIKGYTGVLVNCLFFCCVPAPMRDRTFDNTCSGGNWGWYGMGRAGRSVRTA
jgi:hypothetical protein